MTATIGESHQDHAIAASGLRAGLLNARASLVVYQELYDELLAAGYQPQTDIQRQQWTESEETLSEIVTQIMTWYGHVLDAMTERLEKER